MDAVSLKNAFTKAHTAHSDAIFRFCLWKTSDRDIAIDITQDTFMRFWDEISKGNVIDNERALLYTIARRLVIDHYRKKKTESLDTANGSDDPFDIPDEGALGSIEIGTEARMIVEKMHVLDPVYRQPVYLRFVEGLSPKDIAEILSITPNLASVRIDRGLKELRKLIDPQNV